ncbi:DUF378 domain-containing protein [soil metagenome]
MRASLNPIDWVALLITIVGGLNWGLVALFEWDLVAELLGNEYGTGATLPRVVYGLVGLASIYMIIFLVKFFPRTAGGGAES